MRLRPTGLPAKMSPSYNRTAASVNARSYGTREVGSHMQVKVYAQCPSAGKGGA
jgi:hypothetical protein